MLRVSSSVSDRLVGLAVLAYERLADGDGRPLASFNRSWRVDLDPVEHLVLTADEDGQLEAAFLDLDGVSEIARVKSPSFTLRASGDGTTAYLDDEAGISVASSTIDRKWRLLAGPRRVDCGQVVLHASGVRPRASLGPRQRLSPLAKRSD